MRAEPCDFYANASGEVLTRYELFGIAEEKLNGMYPAFYVFGREYAAGTIIRKLDFSLFIKFVEAYIKRYSWELWDKG